MDARKMISNGAETGRSRVLVADDSRVVRTILSACLEQAGYQVTPADDGSKALELLQAAPFDVVITNLQMPNVGGFGVLEAVRKRALDVEVIVLTSDDDMESAVHALRLGAYDYLLKPPSRLEEVVLAVERAAEKKRLRGENRRLLRELETLSRTDFLTGLPNRRSFEEAMAREFDRVKRHAVPLTVAILDIDFFKSVNDGHGHPTGDEVLRWFAGMACASFRDSDAVYRYGGEEFAVLLPLVPPEGAAEAARRFVQTVARTPFRKGGLELRITCSVGLAVAAADDENGACAVARADQALYQAKASGRNHVVAQDVEQPEPAPVALFH